MSGRGAPTARDRAARPARRARAALASVTLAAALAHCGGPQTSASASAGLVGVTSAADTPVELTLERASNREPLRTATLRGRAVLVVAFLMDDLSSQRELESAERLAREHPQDLTVIALCGDHHPFSQLLPMAQVFGHVVGLERTELVLADDAINQGASPLGTIERVPVTYLINRAGALSRRVDGYLTYERLAALVAPALPSRAPAPAAPP